MSLQPLLAAEAAHHSGQRASTFPAAPPTALHEEIRLHLDERGYVPFHPLLAEKLGHKAAISEKSKRDRALLRISALDLDSQPGPEKNAVSCKLEAQESAVSCKQAMPFPATYIQKETNTTTTLVRSSRSRTSFPKADPSSLFITNKLSELQRTGVLEVLGHVPEAERQRLLDELEGHLSNKAKAIQNPAGWLYGLIRNCAEGPVVFAYADQVASDRKQRQELLDRQAKNEAAPLSQQPTPTPGDDMYSPEARARRARLREKQSGARPWKDAP